ncbi:Uu.00g076630.m01.CDS01 [Anthostomella pinea]|uniref:Uu.00g076630.m01.CDS01 n=1 Tax=Anthostomella pinea TaxID=933095 RepID=A0AAI8VVY1_9PEZI|nr:Uu.00g076630.m01.CDS01 [Anthostomella pinea]
MAVITSAFLSKGPLFIFCVVGTIYTLYVLPGSNLGTQTQTPSSLAPTTTTSEPSDETTTLPPISRKIWQAYLSNTVDEGAMNSIHHWPASKKTTHPPNPVPSPKSPHLQDKPTAVAPNWTYTLLGDAGANAFVDTTFHDRADIRSTYHALSHWVLKSDFLRYMLLWGEGGIYSDLDTKPQVAPSEWVPAGAHRDRVRLIVAIEYDSAVLGPTEMYPIQFSQWTIGAAARHPVMGCMLERALTGIRDMAAAKGITVGEIDPGENAVYNATGPIAWTECVMDGIGAALGPDVPFAHSNLSEIAEPRYYGDITILPDGYFAAALPVGSPKPNNGDRVGLVSHDFRGAWKHS